MKLHLDLENLHGSAGGRPCGVKIVGTATVELPDGSMAVGKINVTGKIESAAGHPYRATFELRRNSDVELSHDAGAFPPWKANGFESEAEMTTLVMAVDPFNESAHRAFKQWIANDGTKAGLVKLLDETKRA